jgi:hypothetical protein
MNGLDPTRLGETLPARSTSSATSEPSIPTSDVGAAPPPPPAPQPDASVTIVKQLGQRRVRRLLSNKRCRLIVAAVMMSPVIGLSIGLAVSPSASAGQFASGSSHADAPGSASGGPTARSGPAVGGSAGTDLRLD